MIPSSTAALGVSVARGVIKLGRRLDQLLAEKATVNAGLVLAMPAFYKGPSGVQKVDQLRAFLKDPPGTAGPDPLGADRADLVRELAKDEPDNAVVGACYRLVFPERLAHAPFDPDAAYVAELRKRLPTFDLSNPDTLAAAFSFSAGQDDRAVGYSARVGLLVADVVAEFGAEHSARFVRDPAVSGAVQAVLERFAKPDLEQFTAWSPLVRHALGATLNGLLDARPLVAGDHVWLGRLLDVLAEARADPTGGDDFVVGLLQGRGYRLLVSRGLGRAASTLAEDEADVFKQLASDVLKAAAPLAQKSPDFKAFFSDHWGDLVGAGLRSFERLGPAALAGQPALLQDVLLGMVRELHGLPAAGLLSSDTLFSLGDAAIAAVAARPGLLAENVGDRPWLRVVLESFVHTVDRDGLRHAVGPEGLEAILTDAAGVVARHPELLAIAKNAGFVREVVGGILRAVGDLPATDARSIVTAASHGALRALAGRPDLIDTRFAERVAEFSKRLSEVVRDRRLTGSDAAVMVSTVVESLLGNPALFVATTGNLATAALDAILLAAEGDAARLLGGANLIPTVRAVLGSVARHGKIPLAALPIEQATAQLREVIQDALAQLSDELGRRLDLSGVPAVVGGVVGAWARGEFKKIDPADPAFGAVFSDLLRAAAMPARFSA